ITGFGRIDDIENLQHAKERHLINDYFTDIKKAVENADCVVIATPVGSFETIFKQLKPYWSEKTIYTDTGSTKGSVVMALQHIFGAVPENFIPAHPIAGAEQSGAAAAILDLFKHKRLIITPLKETNQQALITVHTFWEKMGARVSLMEMDHHDTVFAATSHLPHILAYALTDLLGDKNETVEIFKYATSGFSDFTRIASSDPTMWADISMANKDKIIPLIAELRAQLGMIESSLITEDKTELFKTFRRAKSARQDFLKVAE
ncbi:MAG: prephenate dehydrogenase/arogenate dehydrogenase family protein, partial [Methylococcales bacterium]|nr:prephenate dehydrogenase/arogenate dehydrogenase family protein [Methylococcales bacterium]